MGYANVPFEYGSGGGYMNTQNMYYHNQPVNNIPIERFHAPDISPSDIEMVEDTPISMYSGGGSSGGGSSGGGSGEKPSCKIGAYSAILVIIVLFFALELWAKAGTSLIQTKYYKGGKMGHIEYGIWAVLATLMFVVVAKLVKLPMLDL